MTPGPKEPDSEQIQEYLQLIVDDLIMLWKYGIWILTPSCPQGEHSCSIWHNSILTLTIGWLIHIILLAIVCDHPAMCKISGFADHSHGMAPCTKCKVTQVELYSECSLKNGMEISDRLHKWCWQIHKNFPHEMGLLTRDNALNGVLSRQTMNGRPSSRVLGLVGWSLHG